MPNKSLLITCTPISHIVEFDTKTENDKCMFRAFLFWILWIIKYDVSHFQITRTLSPFKTIRQMQTNTTKNVCLVF